MSTERVLFSKYTDDIIMLRAFSKVMTLEL